MKNYVKYKLVIDIVQHDVGQLECMSREIMPQPRGKAEQI
jgi:hypothetical protein